MKAALLYQNEPALRIQDIETPVPGDGEALLKVEATGLCRTDLKLIHGFLRPRSYPHVLGHEIAGKVIDSNPSGAIEREILEKITQSGGKVLVYPDVGCGHCSFCLEGRMNLCAHLRRPGFEFYGGFAEYVKVPIRNLIASKLGREAAILTDAGAVMLHALRRARLQPGMRVVVAGVGGLGTMAVQLINLFGCDAIALDIDDGKLSYASEMGAQTTINVNGASASEVRERMTAKTGGKLADLFIDLVGNGSNQGIALNLLAHDGKLLQIGYSEATLGGIPLKDVVYHELQVIGSLACSIYDLNDVIDLTQRGRLKLNVTKAYNLSEINSAVQDLEQNRINGRSIVVP